jgi:glutaredoxin 3
MLTVYSKDNCPFCTRAKALLESKGVEFEEVRVDLDPEAKQFIVDAGHRSVPQIYLNGKIFVEGGYTGLAALDNLVFQQLKENINVN